MKNCDACETKEFCSEGMGRCFAEAIYEKFGEASADDELEDLTADSVELKYMLPVVTADEPLTGDVRDLIIYAIKN